MFIQLPDPVLPPLVVPEEMKYLKVLVYTVVPVLLKRF